MAVLGHLLHKAADFLLLLQAAYALANSSSHMVHANRGPMHQIRTHPETYVKQGAYYVQLTTVGLPRELRR